jgi:uncharacterized protein YbbC (DUF1343 family)/CubicO group peptidase (beta-lactamase class C family)
MIRRPFMRAVLAAILATQSTTAAAAELSPEKLAELDGAIRRRVEEGRLPGAVVWVERRGDAHHRAFGWRSVVPEVTPMTEDTIFDVASLTKVVATTPAIMKLVEDGKIDIEAPVASYLPEFTGDGRDAVPVKWLMTHNSGLPPGIKFDASEPWSGYAEGIARACREPLRYSPGTDFVYSDINFILLGEIVRRVSGEPLNEFCERNVFAPLAMGDTGYLPPAGKRNRIAPTTVETGDRPLRGVVHDPTSRRMGGVCGHAGLFTTAHDLARYCRMLLNRGMLDGVRILREETVAMMTRVQSPPEVQALRALGWDYRSRFTRQRGDFFPDGSFGHTGWTGPSLWIDPASQTFIVFVTNRNHPSELGSTGTLRDRIGTLAAEAAADWHAVALPGLALPIPHAHAHSLPLISDAPANVLNGIDVLERDGFKAVQGLRIGLITNQTGIDRSRRSTIDLLAAAPNVKLTALFSPEHGIRGTLDQAKISDSKDEKSGVPVYSLYGAIRAPTAQQLAGLDALVFDIQDIGCRFYTYISTLSLALEAAARHEKKFIVLDRVNPIGGIGVRGPLREGPDSFLAAHRIPVQHGMTAGELARMMVAEKKSSLDLQVIKCEGWTRERLFDETGLPWVNPSPNMRSLTAALLYPGVGLLEYTNLSVGRGTDSPFEVVGAPWIDEILLAREFNAIGLEGVQATPIQFTPSASTFKAQLCHGLRFTVTDRHACPSVVVGAAVGSALCRHYPKDFQTTNLNKLLLHEKSASAIKAARPPAEIQQLWRADERAFIIRRRKFLLY